jgi:hypothetical protein
MMEVHTGDWFSPTYILHISLALITLRDGLEYPSIYISWKNESSYTMYTLIDLEEEA